mmetsp:Transcript_21729/g.60342  ORF Transcript_21729/g.60342 Transcript_21729/m.60342 type:complete len:145 (-) Transcript_21729:415-849(-)
MHTSRYTGDSRNYDFEKHCRTWLNYQTILVTHDKFPDKQDFTMNFIHTLHDKGLEIPKLQVLDNAKYTSDFNACLALFKRALRIQKMGAAITKRNRSVFAVSRDGSDKTVDVAASTYSDIVEDRYYSEAEYNNLSTEHRKALYE